MTFITVRVEVSCLLRFTPGVNLGAHTSQFGSGEVSCLLRFTLAANLRVNTYCSSGPAALYYIGVELENL